MAPAEVVSRARACLGARFRLHGRDPALGLDCVGVVAFAYRLDAVPAGYALRGGEAAAVVAGAEAFGFRCVDADAAGDLLVMAAGPFQQHLAVWTGDGFVHADARLRRVVETPGMPGWPVKATLRFKASPLRRQGPVADEGGARRKHGSSPSRG